jgi:uncharacterized protein YdaU (DUF1376 family)
MGAVMHYYKKNLGDYYKKAGRLSMLQHGAYTLLIDACYDRERFPTELQAIEWTWASTKEEEQAVKFVLSRFFKPQDDGTYVQTRVYEELQAFKIGELKNRLIALSREAKKRKRNEFAEACDQLREEITHDPSAKPHAAWTDLVDALTKQHEAPPNQEPITNNQEPLKKNSKKKSMEYSSAFKSAMADYPDREGGNPMRSAFRAWNARLKAGATVKELHQGVIRYANFIRAKGKEHTSYVKQASTFFGPDEHYKEPWEITSNEANQSPSGCGSGQQSPAAARNQMHRNLYRRLAAEAAAEEGMGTGDLRKDEIAL